jgi:hypothetical protein
MTRLGQTIFGSILAAAAALSSHAQNAATSQRSTAPAHAATTAPAVGPARPQFIELDELDPAESKTVEWMSVLDGAIPAKPGDGRSRWNYYKRDVPTMLKQLWRWQLRREDGSARDAWLGIGLGDGVTPDQPLVVRFLVLRSGADQAGVKVNDKIIAIDDVKDPGWLIMPYVARRRAGEEVRLTVERTGVPTPIELRVRLMNTKAMDELLRRPYNQEDRPGARMFLQ